MDRYVVDTIGVSGELSPGEGEVDPVINNIVVINTAVLQARLPAGLGVRKR